MKHRSRLERAEQRGAAVARLATGQPQRHVAADLGVARSTLQDWCKPTPVGAAPALLAAFVATPEGVQWLHQRVGWVRRARRALLSSAISDAP